MFKKVRSMLFGYIPRIASALIALTMLSCSMQANLEEFVEEGISLVKITSSSYSQGVSPNFVANRSVVSGSDVTVNLEFLNPEGLDLEYEIGYDASYIDGGEIPTIDPTGPEQNSVSFTFIPLPAATGNTITFTIAIRSPKFNKIVACRSISIPCVSASNTDIRLQAILGNKSTSYGFSETGVISETMGLTDATAIILIPTTEAPVQSMTCMLDGTSYPLYHGSQTSVNLVPDAVNTLTITVTAHDGTIQPYSLVVPQGYQEIPGGEYTVSNFSYLANSSSHIRLGGDITLTDVASDSIILDNHRAAFVFDGNGHKIKNLRINATDGTAFISANEGIIQNLTLENVTITSSSTTSVNVGALVGINWGSIYRCSVSGTILVPNVNTENQSGVGGLVGHNLAISTISECYSTATVTGVYHVGGLVGYSSNGIIQNCYARGHVSKPVPEPFPGTGDVGGLVGTNTSPSVVRNSYATDASSGSLFGSNDGTVANCSYGSSPLTVNWNITNTLNPAYVWGIGSGINGGYPYLQYFGAQTMLPP